MKLAIIGGAGVRVPLLARGLVHADLPIKEVALFDTDQARLNVIADLAQKLCGDQARITTHATCKQAAQGTSFVFTSVRVGGIAQRARDEAVSIANGCIGQETIGPAGFALAVRTIPVMVQYATEIAEVAPEAWIINFTNPVGIITQAVRTQTKARIIGICDTPTELFEEVAHALNVPSADCHFDYLGLNHLGWLREVYIKGVPSLGQLFQQPEKLKSIYRAPLFDTQALTDLKLIPTEYVHYFMHPERALANVSKSGTTRGQAIQRMNEELFQKLNAAPADPVAVYEQYLDGRNKSYMQLESGAQSPLTLPPSAALTGYDKIALSVASAIHHNRNAIIPLDVTNNGNMPCLETDDVIEVPCVVNTNGALPLHVGRAPKQVEDVLKQVKHYERLTIQTALQRSRTTGEEALATHPLIGSSRASAVLNALDPLW